VRKLAATVSVPYPGVQRGNDGSLRRHTAHCRGDGNAVFNYRFDLKDVSPSDYWHPSERGQETLAQVAWEAGFWS
jgi:hypothetical protein